MFKETCVQMILQVLRFLFGARLSMNACSSNFLISLTIVWKDSSTPCLVLADVSTNGIPQNVVNLVK